MGNEEKLCSFLKKEPKNFCPFGGAPPVAGALFCRLAKP